MYFILALLTFPFLAIADFVPTAPGPGDTFKQGGPCTMQWNSDTSGQWKQTYIELMTGSNSGMVHLTTVGVVDGTDPTKTSFSFPCPSVTPHSDIYFYQYTTPNTPNVTWTSRFPITDSSGTITPAPNDKQPNGDNIPWGTGQLLGVQGTPPPPSAPPGQTDGSSSSGNTIITSSGPASASGLTLSGVSLSTTLPTEPSSSASQSIVTAVVQPSATSRGAAAPASSGTTANNNGASRYQPSPATMICIMFILAATGLS